VESTRKLRRELGYEVAKLQGLQQTVDLTLDEASATALAVRIREQAGICLDLLDHYQSSVPGRMWSDAERKCQPLREDLKRTEMLFRANSGEWDGRALTRSHTRRPSDWVWDDFSEPVGGFGSKDPYGRGEQTDSAVTSYLAPSRGSVEDDDRQSLDSLMALVDDVVARDAGTATGPLKFTLPMDGDSPEQNMLVLVPSETGLVYEHQYGGSHCRHAEVEGFLVPAWAHPEAKAALDRLFSVDLGGNGVGDEDRSEVVRTAGDAVQRIWYRGTGDRMAPLQIDEERVQELDEAWVPVLTPDGPAYLAWINSD
jgi:hypothetical protein